MLCALNSCHYELQTALRPKRGGTAKLPQPAVASLVQRSGRDLRLYLYLGVLSAEALREEGLGPGQAIRPVPGQLVHCIDMLRCSSIVFDDSVTCSLFSQQEER